MTWSKSVLPDEALDPDCLVARLLTEQSGHSRQNLPARAALAQPEPVAPTDEELIQLAIDTRLYRFQATAGDPVQYEMTEQQVHAFARAALARWGTPANTINQEDYDGG